MNTYFLKKETILKLKLTSNFNKWIKLTLTSIWVPLTIDWRLYTDVNDQILI